MRIMKPIDGVLEIEPDSGTIWINSYDGNCVLRIGGLKFAKTEEKFSMIDIVNGKAVMYKEGWDHTMITNFLETIFSMTSSKILTKNSEERQQLFTKILDNVKKCILEEK